MKVAVSVQGTTLDAQVEPRFGRCRQIMMVDTDSLEYTTLSNPHIGATGGAGIQTAQMVSTKKVDAVFTGHCGPKAFQTLQAAGIPVYVEMTGTVREAIAAYNSGDLQPAAGANAQSHAGSPGQHGRA